MKRICLGLLLVGFSVVTQNAYASQSGKNKGKSDICGRNGWGKPSQGACQRMQAAQKELDRRDRVAQAQRCLEQGHGSPECRGPGIASEAARQQQFARDQAAVAASLTPASQVAGAADKKSGAAQSKNNGNGHGRDSWGHSYGSQSGKR